MKSRLAHVLTEAYGITSPRPPVLVRAEPATLDVGEWQAVRVIGEFLHPSDTLLVTAPQGPAGPLAELRNLAFVDPATLEEGESAFDLEMLIDSQVADQTSIFLAVERDLMSAAPLVEARAAPLDPVFLAARAADAHLLSGGRQVGEVAAESSHRIEVFVDHVSAEDFVDPETKIYPIVDGTLGETADIFIIDGRNNLDYACAGPLYGTASLRVGAGAPQGTVIGLHIDFWDGRTAAAPDLFVVAGDYYSVFLDPGWPFEGNLDWTECL